MSCVFSAGCWRHDDEGWRAYIRNVGRGADVGQIHHSLGLVFSPAAVESVFWLLHMGAAVLVDTAVDAVSVQAIAGESIPRSVQYVLGCMECVFQLVLTQVLVSGRARHVSFVHCLCILPICLHVWGENLQPEALSRPPARLLAGIVQYFSFGDLLSLSTTCKDLGKTWIGEEKHLISRM